jgi:hypothetical protein
MLQLVPASDSVVGGEEPCGGPAVLEVDPSLGPTVSCPTEGWSVAFGATRFVVYCDGDTETVLVVTYAAGVVVLDLRRAAMDNAHSPQSLWMRTLVQRLSRCCSELNIKLVLEPAWAAALAMVPPPINMEGR